MFNDMNDDNYIEKITKKNLYSVNKRRADLYGIFYNEFDGFYKFIHKKKY